MKSKHYELFGGVVICARIGRVKFWCAPLFPLRETSATSYWHRLSHCTTLLSTSPALVSLQDLNIGKQLKREIGSG
jgi:hypothetical protein